MIECQSCGAELDPRDTFCSKCGALTDRGKGPAELVGRYAAEVSVGLGKFASAIISFATDPENRTRATVGLVAVLFLCVVLTDNPVSERVGGLFASPPSQPTLNDDGTPNFAEYEDVFIGEETKFYVTGSANVRDFPTGQGTQVQRSLTEGQTVDAREVMAFDPTSQWYKLSDGGYVWGQNLYRLDQDESVNGSGTSDIAFAPDVQGRWSDMASCRGYEPDTRLEISGNEIHFADSVGTLHRVTTDEFGREEYHIDFFGNDHEWEATWRISLTANGFTLLVDDVEFADAATQSFHNAEAGCRPEFMME